MAAYDPYSSSSSYDDYGGSDRGGGGSVFGPWGASRAPVVTRNLILVNVGIFFLQLVLGRFTSFDYWRYFALNTDLAIGQLWVWQFVTSAFMHDTSGVWHILFNMLALWFFGRPVEQRLGSRRFLVFYLLAAAFAALCFAIVAVLGARIDLAVGASGAVMGVLVLFASFYPEATVLAMMMIPVKAKHLVMFLIAMDLLYFTLIAAPSRTAHSAHLGGALFGFLYFRYEGRVQRFVQNMEHRDAERSRKTEKDARARVDQLLDKLGSGERLTPKERKFLEQASKKYYPKKGR